MIRVGTATGAGKEGRKASGEGDTGPVTQGEEAETGFSPREVTGSDGWL